MIGLIGGSGFYKFFTGKNKEIKIKTKYGWPSDKIIIGTLFGKKVAFLPRHGRKHTIPPHKINYQANIAALKQLGVSRIIAPCAVGSLKTKIRPGDFVFCDQFVDRTKKRNDTFFGGPKVVHLEMADPYCSQLRKIAAGQAEKMKLRFHPKGTAVVIEGPRFSTSAESLWFSKMDWDVVGMTQYPEAVLAGEMGICYLNISLVTDYDVGIYSQKKVAPVSVKQVLDNFGKNIEKLKNLISLIIKNIPEKKTCDCRLKAERAAMN
ncbi:MAG: S-methyl-5'-thioadenosine phosphorylase [Candidatus Parcubacteria bacterium]|nr:S-methyl-5'-thioadenosine phosphorylase [Candidatus Parcubacteria bacterium]